MPRLSSLSPDERFPPLGLDLPKASPAAKRRAANLLAALDDRWPNARCELNYRSPHELLVATILSAQATDASVNKATPALFEAFPTPLAFASASPAQIEPFIQSLGLFRTKAKAIHESMAALVHRFGGEVPRSMPDLLTLRGVARKTANVVLGNAFGIQAGMPVDTHVMRLSVRLGLCKQQLPADKLEPVLLSLFPRERWCDVSHRLIWHGRYTCKARNSLCNQDPVCQRFHA